MSFQWVMRRRTLALELLELQNIHWELTSLDTSLVQLNTINPNPNWQPPTPQTGLYMNKIWETPIPKLNVELEARNPTDFWQYVSRKYGARCPLQTSYNVIIPQYSGIVGTASIHFCGHLWSPAPWNFLQGPTLTNADVLGLCFANISAARAASCASGFQEHLLSIHPGTTNMHDTDYLLDEAPFLEQDFGQTSMDCDTGLTISIRL